MKKKLLRIFRSFMEIELTIKVFGKVVFHWVFPPIAEDPADGVIVEDLFDNDY